MTVEEFAEMYETARLAEIEASKLQHRLGDRVRIRHRLKYILIDFGDSGVFMIEKASGDIFGIRGYGKVNRDHTYGNLRDYEVGDRFVRSNDPVIVGRRPKEVAREKLPEVVPVVHGWSVFQDGTCCAEGCARKGLLARDSGRRLNDDGDLIGCVELRCVEHFGTADELQAEVSILLETLNGRERMVNELLPNPFKQRDLKDKLGIKS